MGMVAVKLRSRDLIVSISLSLACKLYFVCVILRGKCKFGAKFSNKNIFRLRFLQRYDFAESLGSHSQKRFKLQRMGLFDRFSTFLADEQASLAAECMVLTKHHKICSKDYGARNFLCIKLLSLAKMLKGEMNGVER
jgi:hypothetical protein